MDKFRIWMEEFWDPLSQDRELEEHPEFLYHATTPDNVWNIIQHGFLVTNRPWYGTEQQVWPDGSTEKRSYWSPRANRIFQWVPSHQGAIIRTRLTNLFRQEGRSIEWYTRKKIPINQLEVMALDGRWIRMDAPELKQ